MATTSKQSVEALHKDLAEKRESIRAFRFKETGSHTRNVKEGKALRKDIARILTELRSRELAIVQNAA